MLPLGRFLVLVLESNHHGTSIGNLRFSTPTLLSNFRYSGQQISLIGSGIFNLRKETAVNSLTLFYRSKITIVFGFFIRPILSVSSRNTNWKTNNLMEPNWKLETT